MTVRYMQRDRQRHKVRKIERQRDRESERQRDRELERRGTESQKERGTESQKESYGHLFRYGGNPKKKKKIFRAEAVQKNNILVTL